VTGDCHAPFWGSPGVTPPGHPTLTRGVPGRPGRRPGRGLQAPRLSLSPPLWESNDAGPDYEKGPLTWENGAG
jgi:hypothetical protein